MQANTDYFLAHMIRPFTRYRPDVAALRAASTQIVVAGGATSTGQLPHRTAVALADQLDTTVVAFPGDHAGFARQPERFADLLRQVLTKTTSETA
jgi:clorobiocin biosynthesis protein CloN7